MTNWLTRLEDCKENAIILMEYITEIVVEFIRVYAKLPLVITEV